MRSENNEKYEGPFQKKFRMIIDLIIDNPNLAFNTLKKKLRELFKEKAEQMSYITRDFIRFRAPSLAN